MHCAASDSRGFLDSHTLRRPVNEENLESVGIWKLAFFFSFNCKWFFASLSKPVKC